MTREEAIKQIEEFMVIDDWSLVYLPDLHEALETAIEALKEQGLVCDNCHYWNEHLNYCYHHSTFMNSDDYCSDHINKGEGEVEWERE